MFLILLFSSTLLFANKSLAYFNLMDTGELRKGENTRILGTSQLILNKAPEGLNFGARYAFDFSGMISHSELQFEAHGGSSVDYQIGAFFKWIPFPDTDSQPAIGLRTGFNFAKILGYSNYGFNLTPLLSKHTRSSIGKITPYLGIPIGFFQNVLISYINVQVSAGVEWAIEDWQMGDSRGFNFLVEYAVGLSQFCGDSVSLALAYDF